MDEAFCRYLLAAAAIRRIIASNEWKTAEARGRCDKRSLFDLAFSYTFIHLAVASWREAVPKRTDIPRSGDNLLSIVQYSIVYLFPTEVRQSFF